MPTRFKARLRSEAPQSVPLTLRGSGEAHTAAITLSRASQASRRDHRNVPLSLSRPMSLRERLEARGPEIGVEGDRPTEPLPVHEGEARSIHERDR